jgi:APA family basic amino acid/polyamine antiporter
MPEQNNLKRELGLFHAIMMGLGSILGTGIFVSVGLAAGIAGPSVILAIFAAALVAACNALSSAQLAAAHPVSGGTYEYGYRFLKPSLGFLAGWMFLLAKSASAATAALGFAGYALAAVGISSGLKTPVAVAVVLVFTVLVLTGVRRSAQANAAIVAFTVLGLLLFAGTSSWYYITHGNPDAFTPFFTGDDTGSAVSAFLQATALMFVAYTGYGRIATLAEEVKEPRRTIPRAIIATLLVSALLYLLVSASGIAAVGSSFLFEATEGQAAPLELAVRHMEIAFVPLLIAIAAATAMLGVLLNLILGLSRVLFAMGRRRDMPSATARLDAAGANPYVAVIVMGVVITLLASIGSVRTTWTFSAFTVLIYYAITNACALALPREQRLFPRWIAVAGLVACLLLAFWVPVHIWLVGLALGAAGLIWFWCARRLSKQ